MKAREKINKLNELCSKVTGHHVIGSILHSELIEVTAQPHSYTRDWALIRHKLV